MGTPSKTLTEKEEEIKEEYLKTLQDLTFNSKPLIDVLTEVAEENKEYASTIADCIVEQLEKVADPLKLPILYLIDSIIKNIGQHYMYLFCKNIDRLFTKVYEQGDENVRNRLLKLRFTWNGILPVKVLSSLDRMVQAVNPMWPTTNLIHVNPKFVSISTHVTAPNGSVTTSAQTPQNPPAFRIAPVSSQLINAAKRVRDPRLRKIELQQIRPSNNIVSSNKETKTTTNAPSTTTTATTTTSSTRPIEPKIDPKNDRKPRSEVKEKFREKESTKVRVEVRMEKSQQEGGETKAKSRSETKPKKKDKPEKPIKISELFSEWARDEKKPSKVWSKEERDKGLKVLANALDEDNNRDSLLENLSQNYPKVAQKLLKLMKQGKSDGSGEKDKKGSSHSKSTGESASKRAKISSLKASSSSSKTSAKTGSASSKPSTSTLPVTTVATTSTTSSSTSVPPVAEVTSSLNTIAIPKKSSQKPKIIAEPSTPLAVTAPATSSEPAPTLTPISLRVCTPPTAEPEEMPVVTEAEESVVTTTAPEVTSAVSVGSPIVVSTSGPTVSSVPSPTLPIPPPAPIISSNAEAKTQDIDYRQIFGFQLLNVPPIINEDEGKEKSEEPEVTEIIDLDAMSPKPRKRKHEERKYRMHKRRKTNSGDSSEDSKHSPEISHKRGIDIEKLSEDEGSRGFDEIKKCKTDDSFYSQSQNTNVEEKPSSDLIIMSVSETPRVGSESPPIFSKFDSNFSANLPNPEYGLTHIPEIPPTDLNVVKMVDEDSVKSINIDGVSREIRHYGYTAVVFMHWDDPREISFFNGVRNVIIDDKFGIPCSLNAPEVETLVYGKKHRFRLGVPTRELYVDGRWHECYFGGPAIEVRLSFKHYRRNHVKLEGPPPSVNIGTVKRLDLVAGKINIIINDEHKHPVFLDAKPQYFLIDGKPVVLMFIDGLKRVLINNVPFRTDFGGASQSFKILNKVYSFRFTVLPLGITPGINLSQMIVSKLPSPPPLPPQFQYSVSDNPTSLPQVPIAPPVAPVVSTVIPAVPSAVLETSVVSSTNTVPSVAAPPAAANLLENISIDELFQKLVASGIVPNLENKQDDGNDTVKRVDFDKPETLKQRQPGLIKMLYSGIQCGSCGLRFPAEQTLKYSQHLDWHFRLNRKGKDGARTIHSRKWYYAVNDWTKFQEMEDNSDRGTSWFDNHPVTEYTEEILEDVPCVPAGSNQNVACELCRDRFEQFYNDESDEWQLKNAIKVDDLIYHPICYQDHKEKSETEPLEVEPELPVVIEEEPAETPTVPEEKPREITMEEDDDSDIEEVQVIEQPIEEIIINDDGNDFDEPNLETLNTEDIIAAQQEIVEDPVIEPKSIKIEEPDRIVDITDPIDIEPCLEEPEIIDRSPPSMTGPECLVTMDGNIELVDSPAQVLSGPTKIKINITKNHSEDRVNSPKVDETKIIDEVKNDGEKAPPDEEILVPSSIKDKVNDAKLAVYPPVYKGVEKSGLCSIM